MRRLRRRSSVRSGARSRRIGGGGAPLGLIVGLHGYGADEHQLDTLLPFEISAIVVNPRGDHEVDPGFGWWQPERSPGGAVEFAPSGAVDAAVDRVIEVIAEAQRAEGFPPERTVLVGYSQGAMLALSIAARHPDSIAAVVAGAGFVLPDEMVRSGSRPLDVLLMNGTRDPVVDDRAHADTVERFERHGHRVLARRDPVPHVIDRAQVPVANAFVAEALDASERVQCEPGVPMSISAPRRTWVARPPTSRSNTTR